MAKQGSGQLASTRGDVAVTPSSWMSAPAGAAAPSATAQAKTVIAVFRIKPIQHDESTEVAVLKLRHRGARTFPWIRFLAHGHLRAARAERPRAPGSRRRRHRHGDHP